MYEVKGVSRKKENQQGSREMKKRKEDEEEKEKRREIEKKRTRGHAEPKNWTVSVQKKSYGANLSKVEDG